jgi:tetratricopeptide (TPR) repeat protein
MDQLVVLQEIYSSFSKGGDGLQKIDNKAIEGSCSELIGKLLDSSRKGRIDEDVCRELSDVIQDVYGAKRLGDICRRAGQPDLAVKSYKRALSIGPDPVLRPVLQNNLGQAYASQGNLAKAVFYYQKAADVFARERDRTGLAHVLGNLGSAYRQNRDWDQAIEHCYKSLKTFEEDGDDLGIAQMTGSIGRIYADMDELELAARYFERSLSDFERLGDKRSAAWVLDRLGRIATERQEWDKALGYLHSSISVFEERGESTSLGIVLSNLGRTFLQMGEPTAAREPLERAVLLISRHSKPNYQNALFSLARTYHSLGKKCMREAKCGEAAAGSSGLEQRPEASRFFAQAADRYHELAEALTDGREEILSVAALAKSRTHLAKISEQISDEDAQALAEKALVCLDSAIAYAKDDKKTEILGLQRIIAGMLEAYRQQPSSDDPSKLGSALTNSTEYLMGGACSWASEEASGFLSQALKNINAGIEARRSGKDPRGKLQSAASFLLLTKEHLSAAEKEDGDRYTGMIAQAAQILQGSVARADEQCRETSGAKAACQNERAALLAIAGSMMTYSLDKIEENNDILTWDDSLRLWPAAEKKDSSARIKSEDRQVRPNPKSTEKAELPAPDISKERPLSRDLVLADGSREDSEWGWLVPVKADTTCRSCGQLLLPDDRQPSEEPRFNERLEMPQEAKEERQPPQEMASPGQQEERDKGNEDGIDAKKDHEERAPEDEMEDEGTQFFKAPRCTEVERESQAGPLIHPKALFLLKAMAGLVVILLAIEAILYLI